MNVLVIGSSPNQEGLTAACMAAAIEGVGHAGGHSEEVRLNDMQIGMCQACDSGWGTCRKEHVCQVADGFQALHARVLAADALVLVTPVYWGEMSESAKALTDRLRRCEASRGQERAAWQGGDLRGCGWRLRRRDDHVPVEHGTVDPARAGRAPST